ncbi:MAG: CPBP family intramembrane glutamic endopeptidase [Planctomycetota bacterium]
MASAEGSRRRTATDVQPIWRQYYQDAQRPLYCLLFLFPLVATYEFGAMILRPVAWPERQLLAHSLIQKLLGWFGATGFWLPAVALLLTLFIWHILSRHAWRIHGWVLPLMVVESVLLTAPLFVLGEVMTQVTSTSAPAGGDIRQQLILVLGAGIYEELVFRLYLIAGLAWLLESVLRVSRKTAMLLVVALSAMIFAGCHFTPVGSELFSWQRFMLLVLAGSYLAVVFIQRGLGVAAGCHAAFNIIPLLCGWAR